MGKPGVSLLSFLAVFGLIVVFSAVFAEENRIYDVDPNLVYYGDVKKFSDPAVVCHAEVFKHISHYKIIVRKNLGPKDPQYWILLQKTNKVFKNAVWVAAGELGYDLVAETGGIKASEGFAELPDITKYVIGIVN